MTRTALKGLRPAVLPLLVLSLLLSGCAAESDPDGAPPAADPAASSSPAADEAPGPAECLLGTWKIDNASFEAFMNGLFAGASDAPAGVDISMRVSGGSFMRFDDQGAYYRWAEDFTFETGTGQHAVTHVSNSSQTGEYGVALGAGKSYIYDFLWVAETMVVVHDEVMTVGGIGQVIDSGRSDVTVDVFGNYSGEVPVIEDRESVEGSTPFWCDGDVLKLEVDLGTEILFHRTQA